MDDAASVALLSALRPLISHALDLPPAERELWLLSLRASEPRLAAELMALLAQEGDPHRGDLLDGLGPGLLTPALLAGRRIGAYTLERPLGQGGMGTVWLAHRSDGRFEGRVAIKLLKLALLDPIGAERFRREGTALARLNHPNIARLLDAGVSQDGQPYLVIEYVEGERIDAYCDAARLGPARRLDRVLEVLDAVGHAHANLIVHRDIKPGNILVTSDGDVKLLDFGIAKLLEAEASGEATTLTDVGGRALTPEFAAPEQITGGAVTTATDVYALGVLLYLLLAGRHPTHDGARSMADNLQAVVDTEPPRLSTAITLPRRDGLDAAEARGTTLPRLRREYAGDLDNILAKALKKAPADRYATVAALADDLRRYLRQEPVTARADSFGYRTRKFIRRNRGTVTATAVVAATLLGATGFSIREMREADRQRDEAVEQSRRKSAMLDLQAVMAGDLRGLRGRALSHRERIEAAERRLATRYREQPAVVIEMVTELADRLYEVGDLDGHAAMLGRARTLALRSGLPAQLALVDCNRVLSMAYNGQVDSAGVAMAEARAALGRATRRDQAIAAQCHRAEGQLFMARERPDSAVLALRRAAALTDADGLSAARIAIVTDLAYAVRSSGHGRDASAIHQRLVFELDSAGYTEGDDFSNVVAFAAGGFWELGEYHAIDSVLRPIVGRLESARGPGDPGAKIAALYGLTKLRLDQLDSAELWLGRAAKDTTSAARGALAMWLPAGRTQVEIERGRLDLARRAADSLPVATRSWRLTAAVFRAWLARAAGDRRQALATIDSALRSVDTLPKPPPYATGALITAAEWHLTEGHGTAADSLARRAVVAAAVDSLALVRSAQVGRAELIVARAAAALGDSARARRALEQAITAMANGYGANHPRAREARAWLARLGGSRGG